MTRPRIGLTVDFDEAKGSYALARTYAAAVEAAGGAPIPLLCGDPAAAPEALALCQGIVFTGGDFDLDPALYGEARRPCCGALNLTRTTFEWALCRGALAVGLPVLGVCAGMQLLNVVRGGALHQDLIEDLALRGHQQPPPKDVPYHAVDIAPGTRLAELIGSEALQVNSTHHQAVKRAGDGVRIAARAPDGVVEAIELPEQPFALGVQWHPERLTHRDPRQARLYWALVQAAEAQCHRDAR